MRIAVDAMGGDFAPQSPVQGAFQAAVEDGTSILLVGDRARLEAELAKLGDHGGRIEIVHAEEVVGMDEPAITPIRKKRRSSIRLCAELVKEGRAQAMVTAGNTGAAMIVAKMVIGTIAGVDRPALAAVLPNQTGRTVLLDVGANVDTKPQHLREFAVMGHFYAQEVLGTASPRIGLMSIGEEEGKGTDLTREVFKVLKRTGLNFVGNVEGRDVFNGSVDVIVCDGFVGNVVLKSAEALRRDDRPHAARGDRRSAAHQARLHLRQAGLRRACARAPTTASTAPRRCSGSTAAASSATAARTPRRSRTPSAGRSSSRPPRCTRRSAPRSPSCTARRTQLLGDAREAAQ